jgi:hypothetical protein
VNGATIERHFAELTALWTGQLLRDIGGGFADHPFLNAGAQGTADGMRGGFDLTEVNGSTCPPLGGLEIGSRLCRMPHQLVQFFPKGLDIIVHDQFSQFHTPGERFPACLHASHFNRSTANSPIDVFRPAKAHAKADMHP